MSAWSALGWRTRILAAGACVAVAGGGTGHAWDQADAAKTDPVTCATCHLGVVKAYAHAPMRNAMQAAGANPALETHPHLSVQLNGYTYTVQTNNGKSFFTVSDGADTLSIPIRWALGQQSQTWVLEKDGHYYESLVSYFGRDQRLSTTPGDDTIVPHSLTEAMGRELSTWEVRNCFTCHASGFHAEEPVAAQKLTPGLDCERCHAGGAQHMADAQRDGFASTPESLKKMNAGETSAFCGQCHRTWDKVVREGWHGPPTVRFQPYRLANSKCYDANDKRIGCLACHDPHKAVNLDDAYYDAKCQACHAGGATGSTASAASASTRKTPLSARMCPVAKQNCVSCHMSKVELAGGHAVFTDHQIRVVHAGESYPN